MRIISGKYKGLSYGNIEFNARPTTDFAKESLFNILNNYFFFENLTVLDLFAGSGSIGMEFASRGANDVDLVENDPKNYKQILTFVQNNKISEVRPIQGSAFVFLKHNKKKYNIIFADPPFDHSEISTIPDLVFEKDILLPDGWLILEHPDSLNFARHPNCRDVRKYGKVNFSFFY